MLAFVSHFLFGSFRLFASARPGARVKTSRSQVRRVVPDWGVALGRLRLSWRSRDSYDTYSTQINTPRSHYNTIQYNTIQQIAGSSERVGSPSAQVGHSAVWSWLDRPVLVTKLPSYQVTKVSSQVHTVTTLHTVCVPPSSSSAQDSQPSKTPIPPPASRIYCHPRFVQTSPFRKSLLLLGRS